MQRPEQQNLEDCVANLQVALRSVKPVKKLVNMQIDHQDNIPFSVEGRVGYGPNEILLEQDINLMTAYQDGYVVAPLFRNENIFIQLRDGIQALIFEILDEVGIANQSFVLEKYHNFVSVSGKFEKEVYKRIKHAFKIEKLTIDKRLITDRISEICKIPVTFKSPDLEELFGIRLIRPSSQDHNLPHVDVWLPLFRNALTVYIPLAGSNERSSLPLIPQSHYWKDSEIERTIPGTKINGTAYPLSVVTDTSYGMNYIRPRVNYNEVLILSPYMVHGGAINLNPDITRVSLEMHLWQA